MRLKILVLFLCAGVVGMCQSVAPAPRTSAQVDESRQGIQQRMDCKRASSDFSISGFASQQGAPRFEVPAQNWNGAQVDSKSTFHSPFLIPTAKSCPLFAANGEFTFDQGPYRQWFQAKLDPIPTPWPNAKLVPIPTEWPNAKFEAIPTDWPNLKVAPVASRSDAPSTTLISPATRWIPTK
jgi:hypothetical protein